MAEPWKINASLLDRADILLQLTRLEQQEIVWFVCCEL